MNREMRISGGVSGMNPNFPRIKILGLRSVKLRSISRMKDQSGFGKKEFKNNNEQVLKMKFYRVWVTSF